MKVKNPRTPEEWQLAADLAEAYLQIDSARQYGLISGGPEINIARCEELLRKAKDRGVVPNPDRAITQILESQVRRRCILPAEKIPTERIPMATWSPKPLDLDSFDVEEEARRPK